MRQELIAGVGLRRGCSAEEIVAIVRAATEAVGRPVSVLAAPAFKRQEAGLTIAAGLLGVALRFVEDKALHAAQPSCVTHSALAARAVGHSSIAEASAIAAAGPRAQLVLPRITMRSATCAIAARP